MVSAAETYTVFGLFSMLSDRQLCRSLQDYIPEVLFFNLGHYIRPSDNLILVGFSFFFFLIPTSSSH